jgi:D-alanyl-D-alanine carboxypeptidase (penicillin-binding protein 5/6)
MLGDKMKKPHLTFHHFFILLLIVFTRFNVHANTTHLDTNISPTLKPVVQPSPPHLSSKAYMLIDVDSGKILAEKNATKRLPPASLTKMMTLYVVSYALKTGQIKLSDQVRISENAWKTGGSKMFIREGEMVTVENLIKGIIVDSGNDACVAMAEYLAGNEKNFTALMNQQAQSLGMKSSHFTDSTGLPNKQHYSTAKDLAVLGRALVRDFPEFYKWYKQKWFTYNKIKQPNRNRLLWRSPYVDGIKTGHTGEAGYCLVSSAKKNDMRLLTVVLNAPSDSTRADGSQRLITYGFRFFETYKLYDDKQKITDVRIWKGEKKQIELGLNGPLYITIPTGQYTNLKISTVLPDAVEAPIQKGQKIGEVLIKLNGKILRQKPLLALSSTEKGGVIARFGDSVNMSFHKWFGNS